MVSFGWFDRFDLLLLLCLWFYWLPDLFSSNIGAADQSRRVDLRSWPHIHSISKPQWRCTPRKTNMSRENPPFWWYLPVKMGIFMGYVSFREGMNLENPLLLKGCHWGWKCFLPLLHGFLLEKVCKFSTSWFSVQANRLFPLNHDYPSSVHYLYAGFVSHATYTPSNQHETGSHRTLQKVDFEIIFRFQPLVLGCLGGMY